MTIQDGDKNPVDSDVERARTLNYSTVATLPRDQQLLLEKLNEIEGLVASDLAPTVKRTKLVDLYREADALLARALDPENPDGIIANRERPYPWLASVLRAFVWASKGDFLKAAREEENALQFALDNRMVDLAAMNYSNISDALRRAASGAGGDSRRVELLQRAVAFAKAALALPRGKTDPAIMIISALALHAIGEPSMKAVSDDLLRGVADLITSHPQDVTAAHGMYEAELAYLAMDSPGAALLIERARASRPEEGKPDERA